MNHPVLASLLPVVIVIFLGLLAGRWGWASPASVRDLSKLVFYLLTPALLFRTMSQVRAQALDFMPVVAYLVGVAVLYAGTLAVKGFTRRGAVLGLVSTFSNTVMIGIPLVSLAYGEQGLVTLFTLYTVHTVTLLTCATVVLELSVLREAQAQQNDRSFAGAVLGALRNAVMHPVPLPIVAGLAWGQTGWAIPALVDKPLQLLASAVGPMSLLMVGLSLSHAPLGRHVRGVLGLVAAKNLVMPALVAGIGLALGVRGLPLMVVVAVAGLPAGANTFLFSQRYQVAEEEVTTAVGVSTLLALLTVPVVMALAAML